MNKNNYNVLGVMSGTSLDGIDIAHLNFRKETGWEYEILEAGTIPYSPQWKTRLSEAIHYNDLRLQEFNEEYTTYLAEVLFAFIRKHELTALDAICSHGHTIRHEPEKGLTLQIGNLPKLAKMLGQPVVCDFRVGDVELGGQGAPLVPIGDELLFSQYEYCLNLGGFANVSTRREGRRIAYDICAVNTVLNTLAGRIGLEFDRNGGTAASGKLDEELLQRLNSLSFYTRKPPKSLGVEWVHEQVLPLLERKEDIPGLLRTYTVHAAIQIAHSLTGDPGGKVLITGGGAFNSFLIDQIRERTPLQVVVPADKTVHYKEALIFGFLGVLRLEGAINVLSSVTGASEDHSSGILLEP